MSTQASKAEFFPQWKQEVNRRVAAHLRGKTPQAGRNRAPAGNRPDPDNRAAQAAARVAERFAHAPSYNEALADEARAVVRAAKAASRAAEEAHAAAEYVLAGLEAVSGAAASAEPDTEPDRAPHIRPERDFEHQGELVLTPWPQNPPESPSFDSRWEPELAERPAELARARKTSHKPYTAIFEAGAEAWHEADSPFPGNPGDHQTYAVEPAQPIHANLIQFPREMVATRKVRPRRAEGPLAVAAPGPPQLSIFEVDPGAISTEPATAFVDAPAWMLPKLPGAALEEQPQEETLEEPAPKAQPAATVEPAPMSLRLLAIVVDCGLIAASFLAVAMLAASHINELPGPRTIETVTALALLAISAAYQTLFFTLVRATPGMLWAGIALSTFDGRIPSRAQRCGRLMALLVSVLPLGLGLAWVLFDDSQLTWHDRLSKTYLRKR